MCCGTFANINNGTRDRFGVHSERERKWSPLWTTLVGVCGEIVSTNTGDVQDREDREDDPAPGIHVSRFKSSRFSCRNYTTSSALWRVAGRQRCCGMG
jgi:hypothetical protein